MNKMEELQRFICEEEWEKAFVFLEQLEPEQRNCFEVLYALARMSLYCEQYTQAQEFLSRCEEMCAPDSPQIEELQALQKEIEDRQRPNRKVLMAAYYFPPLAGSGVYRSIKFAKYLSEYHWTPVVVSTDKPPQGWNFSDESLVKEIPQGMEVHRVPDPVNHAKSIDISYVQKVVGFLQFVLEEHPEGKQLLAKFLQQEKGLETMFQFPCHALSWAYEAAHFIESCVDFPTMDVIYTTSGPHSAHLIGYYFKKKYGMPWVADFRDEWVNNPYAQIDLKQAAHQLLYDLEELILQDADYSLTISEEAVKNYIRTFSIPKEKIISITNGYDEWDFRNISFGKEKNSRFTISYIGLLYTQQRNMAPIFMAVRDLIREGSIDSSKIVFHVMGSSDKDNLHLAKQYGLEHQVEISGYSPHTKALQSCVNSDLLLLFVGDEPRFKGIYTGKVFEYLRCGKPVLALAPKDGVVDQILKETGHGKAMLSSEKKAIKQFILQQYQMWESAQENTYLASGKIHSYERKYLTGILAQILNQTAQNNHMEIIEMPESQASRDCRVFYEKWKSIQKDKNDLSFELSDLCSWMMEHFEAFQGMPSYVNLYQALIPYMEKVEQNISVCYADIKSNVMGAINHFLKDLLNQAQVSVFLSNQVDREELEKIKTDFPLREIPSSFLQKNDGLKLLVVTEPEKRKMCFMYPNCVVISTEDIQQYLSQFYHLNDLSYTKLYIDSRYQLLSKKTDIDTIIIGSSAARSDFIEAEMPYPTVSLGITGLDMYYTLKSAEKALEYHPNIKTVIFPMYYTSLFISFLHHPNHVQQAVIDSIVGPVFEPNQTGDVISPVQGQEEKQNPLFDIIVSVEKFCADYDSKISNELTHLPYYNSQFYERPSNGQNAYCFRDKSEKQNDKAAEVLVHMQKTIFLESNAVENLAYLEELLQIAQEKNLRFLVVVPPVTKYYQKAICPQYEKFFRERIMPLMEQYHYPILNYHKSAFFMDEDYVDYDHLNEKGAQKLSKLVSDYLTQEKSL